MRVDYLSAYGTKTTRRMFQEGGPMPAGPEAGGAPMPPEGAPMPPEGGGQGNPQEQIMALAQAAVQGDQQAAMELGMIIAQELVAGGEGGAPAEGAPAPAPEGAPVFRRGGRLA